MLGFWNFISLQCETDAPSAKELKTILLSENYSVYHSVGVLQGSANSAFAGRIALELKIILRSTLQTVAASMMTVVLHPCTVQIG